MPRLNFTMADAHEHLVRLAATPGRIAACSAGLDEAKLHEAPGPRGWSAVDMLAHLRACSEVWTFSIYAMLTETNPTLPLLDERRRAKTTRYATLDFQPSLLPFSLQRAELVRVLRDLSEGSWGRTATIEGRTHSVFSQARRMALHEVEHCEQLEALLASR